MKALVYSGPRDVRVKNVPDAKIERPTDVLVKITSTNICGSDLHMYEGRTNVEDGKILGHENLGQVVEIGKAVDRINDYSKGTAVERILELTGGEGADRGCECVGYQCHDPAGHEVPDATMNDLVKSVRATGGIGVVGVFVPLDPGAADRLAKVGKLAFDFGLFWSKGQHIGTGQANVKAYNRNLRNLIYQGRAKPSWIVSHELALDEAPDAYKHFDERDKGWTKVVLHPAGTPKNGAPQNPQKKTVRKDALPTHKTGDPRGGLGPIPAQSIR